MRSDKGIAAYHRAVFTVSVVVAGDRSRADVRSSSDFRVPDIAKVRRLCPGAERGVLRLDEIADLHAVRELSARP